MAKTIKKKGIRGTTIFIIIAIIIILLDVTNNLASTFKFISDHWYIGAGLAVILLVLLFRWADKLLNKLGDLIVHIFNK